MLKLCDAQWCLLQRSTQIIELAIPVSRHDNAICILICHIERKLNITEETDVFLSRIHSKIDIKST